MSASKALNFSSKAPRSAVPETKVARSMEITVIEERWSVFLSKVAYSIGLICAADLVSLGYFLVPLC